MAPGGGYLRVSTAGGEGDGAAQWFNSLGVSAFVLLYRVAPYHYPAETDDGQRAIRLVRSRAAEFGVDPKRIGMLGFSAGGHLTAATSTIFDAGQPDASDPIDRVSSRPDFAMLMYAVISFNPEVAGPNNLTAYASSGRNLLGDTPDPALIAKMSLEAQVTSATPPTFLYNGTADTLVSPENSFRFYLALRKAGVPTEVHTFENGVHATGLSLGDPIKGTLPDLLKTWLRSRGVVSVRSPRRARLRTTAEGSEGPRMRVLRIRPPSSAHRASDPQGLRPQPDQTRILMPLVSPGCSIRTVRRASGMLLEETQ